MTLKLGDIKQTYQPMGLELNEDTVIKCRVCKKPIAIFKRVQDYEKDFTTHVTCCYCGGRSEDINIAYPGTRVAGYFEPGPTPEDVVAHTYLEPEVTDESYIFHAKLERR